MPPRAVYSGTVSNDKFWGAMASVEGSIQSLGETVALQRARADEAEAKLQAAQLKLDGIQSVTQYFSDASLWENNVLLCKFTQAVQKILSGVET
jgi:hypothetical protein